MKRYPTAWEVAELLRQKTGLRLATIPEATTRTPVWGVEQYLYGPYRDMEDPQFRLFISYWLPLGAFCPDLRLLVCDCEGDFLSAKAEGAERYDVGRVTA
jgi:hypothetical protein